MSLSINTNIASLSAVRRMTENQAKLNTTFSRLTSGLRVSNPSDDSSAFAISQRMTNQIRGMNVAVRNSGDGISVLQVADSALNETANALQKIRELVLSAANPSLSDADRTVVQSNVTDLITEVTRIANDTQYNGKKLIGADGYADQKFQIGASTNQTVAVTFTGATADLLGVNAITLAADGAATENVGKVDGALNSVANIRATLGTLQNRFTTIITGLNNMVGTTEGARSRLLDADISTETANLTKYTIMQQAGAAVLAQANQQANVMLQLLRG